MPERSPALSRQRGQYLHPLPVRIWHWINALGFIILILTGFQLRYMDLFKVVSFETAVKVHNWSGLIIIANYFIWLLFYLFSDKITVYKTELNTKKFFKEFFAQFRYYSYGIFLGESSPHKIVPHDKFNPMQKLTYQFMMLLVLTVQFITGLLLWDLNRFAAQVSFLGGVRVVDTIHVLTFIFTLFFLFLHVYLVTLGHTRTAHIKEMITGYEDVEDDV